MTNEARLRRSLGHALSYLVHEHEPSTCTCDMRPTMAVACVSPWCREEVLRRSAYALGACVFKLEPLPEEEALVELQAAAADGAPNEDEHEQQQQEQLVRSISRQVQCAAAAARLSLTLYRADEWACGDGAAAPLQSLAEVIGWWRERPLGRWSVHIRGDRSALPEMRALTAMAQGRWGAPVTGLRISGYSHKSEDEERQAVLHLLEETAPTLRTLQVDSLAAVPPAASTAGAANVQRLELRHCTADLGALAAWLRRSPLRSVCLPDGLPFRPTPVAAAAPNSSSSVDETELTALTPPTLERLELDETNVTPEHLRGIRCRAQLRRLNLTGCDAVDEVDLAGMYRLRTLLLARCPLTSAAAIKHLADCRDLVLLNISGCRDVSDLSALAGMPSLRELFAYQSGVTNDGIAALGSCQSLEKINFGGCRRLTNVAPLGQLTRLRELHLWRTGVDDRGIAALGGCTALYECVLDECVRVTDVSVLGGLPHLRWLSLIQSSVTFDGIAALVRCPALEALAIAGTEVANAPRMWRHSDVLAFLNRVVVRDEDDD